MYVVDVLLFQVFSRLTKKLKFFIWLTKKFRSCYTKIVDTVSLKVTLFFLRILRMKMRKEEGGQKGFHYKKF